MPVKGPHPGGSGSGGGGGGGLTSSQVDSRIAANVHDWAEAANTDPIPISKIPSEVATDTELAAVSSSVPSNTDIDARIADWAEDGDGSTIPMAKFPSGLATDSELAVVSSMVPSNADIDARIADWAETGNNDLVPASKLGSGTANNGKVLYGDGSWKDEPGGAGGVARSGFHSSGTPAADKVVDMAAGLVWNVTDTDWDSASPSNTVQTAMLVAAAPAITASQAGIVGVFAQLMGETSFGDSGADRMFVEGRIVRVRGTARTVISQQLDYLRPTNQGGTGDNQDASKLSIESISAVDTAQSGDVYRLECRIVAQAARAGRTFTFSTTTNRIDVAAMGGAGTEALDEDVSTTLPRDTGVTDQPLSQRAVVSGFDRIVRDGAAAWGPETSYDATTGTVADGEYKRTSDRVLELQHSDSDERTALLGASALRIGGIPYSAAVVAGGRGIAHVQRQTGVGVSNNVTGFSDQTNGVVRVTTPDRTGVVIGSIVRFNNATANSVALTATDLYRVVAVGATWFEIRSPHVLSGASAEWEVINYAASTPSSDLTLTALAYMATPFAFYRFTTEGAAPQKGAIVTFDGVSTFPTTGVPVTARTATTFDVWLGSTGVVNNAVLEQGHSTRVTVHVHPDLPATLSDPLLISRPDVLVSRRTVDALMSASSQGQQGQGGQGSQGQSDPSSILSNLIGTERSLTLTQGQSRLSMVSASGGSVTARGTAVALPQATAAGDRIRVSWDWHAKPTGLDDDTTLSLTVVPGGTSAREVVRLIFDYAEGVAEWELPAGATSIQFEGAYDPAGSTGSTTATIDVTAAVVHYGAQAIGGYVEAVAASEASDAARQAERSAIAYASAGDVGLLTVLDASVSGLIRRPRTVTAWIRAADSTTALAGTSAATWTNAGSGSPPTGAHWNRANVPSGTGEIFELTAEVSPTPGSTSAWSFGTWDALQVTNTPVVMVQYSVDGSTAWHTVYVTQDRYERRRDPSTLQWGPAVPLFEADRLRATWQQLCSFEIYYTTSNWQEMLVTLPTTVDLSTFTFLRCQMDIFTFSSVLVGKGATLLPPQLKTGAYSERTGHPAFNADASVVIGCSVSKGAYASMFDGVGGSGSSYDTSDPRITGKFVRPSGSTDEHEAKYFRVYEVRNRYVRHHCRIEAL